MKPISKLQIGNELTAQSFLVLIKYLILQVREMAGRALVPLVMPEKVAPLIATLFSSIPSSKGEFEDDS